MKKIILLLVLFILIPINIRASEVDYDITNMYVDSYILENGDLQVRELIVLKGSFNGYIRDLEFKGTNNTKTFDNSLEAIKQSSIYNASNITNIKVYNIDIDKNVNFDYINKDKRSYELLSKSYNGAKYEYSIGKITNGYEIKMYNSTNNNYAGFLIEYTVKDVVVMHNDISELYWNFIGNEFDDKIGKLEIRVNLNKESNYFKAFIHGPLNGNSIINNNSQVIATIDNLPNKKAIDARILMDNSLFTNVSKKSDYNSLDNILLYEKNLMDKANKERETAKMMVNITYVLFALWIISLIIIIIKNYISYDKEYKSDIDTDYYRELPNTYGPEILDYLIKKNISGMSLSSSLLEIIRKKAILITPIDKKDYKLIGNIGKVAEELTENEQYIYDWFIKELGDNNEVLLSTIKNVSKTSRTALEFSTKYEVWKVKALNKAKHYNFFEKYNNFRIVSIIYTIITFVILLFLSLTFGIVHIFLISLIIAFVTVSYLSIYTKRTVFGNNDYNKWMAFKRFLLDFGNFNDKKLEEIAIWERYLVYANSLSMSKELNKIMSIKVKELSEINNTNMSSIYPLLYLNTMSNFNFTRTINQTINTTVTSAYTTAHTSQSSLGGGGGFSGGGGFGGGGGGGRGF